MIIYSVQKAYTVGIKFCVMMKKIKKIKKIKVVLLDCVTVLILLVHCMPCSKKCKNHLSNKTFRFLSYRLLRRSFWGN